jgi:hypothetical protein
MELFHALLLLESQLPGGPGEVPHFYAVACYGVQHPRSMGYTIDTVRGLRDELARVTHDETQLSDVRRRVRFQASMAGRVTRRSGDAVPTWPVADWPITVVDVLAHGVDGYEEWVGRWASSVAETLEGLKPSG